MNTIMPSYWRDANQIREVRDALHAEARQLHARVAERIEAGRGGFTAEESLTNTELIDAIDATTHAMVERENRTAPLVVRDVEGAAHDVTAALSAAYARGRADVALPAAPADLGPGARPATTRTLAARLLADRSFQTLRAIPGAVNTNAGFDLDMRDIVGATCGPLLIPPPPLPALPAPLALVVPPPRVADLLLHRPAGEVCKYTQLVARTGGTAVVPPATAKPVVTINGTILDAVFEKLAGHAVITDEQLEDSNDALASVINTELYNDLANKVNAEILAAPGGAGRFVGLLLGATGPDTAHGAGTAPTATILTEVGKLFDASGEMADGLVCNFSTAVACASVLATTGGMFLTGAPLMSATPAWAGGLRVAIEPTMADGVALVGSFSRGAELASKKGLRFDRLSSGDAWLSNQTLFRIETRVALMILRPLAFGNVTGLPDGTP